MIYNLMVYTEGEVTSQ